MGLSAFSELAINATEWRTAYWAKERGLFNEVFETVEQLDAYIVHFTEILIKSSPDAMRELKRILWHGTEGWDELLAERAAISGRLVLSDFTKNAIAQFKQKA
jgi:methylglutaconyl-CoA hydratase